MIKHRRVAHRVRLTHFMTNLMIFPVRSSSSIIIADLAPRLKILQIKIYKKSSLVPYIRLTLTMISMVSVLQWDKQQSLHQVICLRILPSLYLRKVCWLWGLFWWWHKLFGLLCTFVLGVISGRRIWLSFWSVSFSWRLFRLFIRKTPSFLIRRRLLGRLLIVSRPKWPQLRHGTLEFKAQVLSQWYSTLLQSF